VDEALAVGLPDFPEGIVREGTDTDKPNWGKLVADTPEYQGELARRGIVREAAKGRPTILRQANPGPAATADLEWPAGA
jgi:hypothetical protein